MIKNWKLFLENSSEDDEMKENGEILKNDLKIVFKPILITESLLRRFEMFDEIKQSVSVIYEAILSGFEQSINDRFEGNEELSDIIKTYFKQSLDASKIVMEEKSFEEGIDFMIDKFVLLMQDLKKSLETEGEEWKQEKERDYSELSQREIQKLIDDALDERDFKRVEFLSQYLKESVLTDFEEKIQEVIKLFSEKIVEFVFKYFSKF